MKGFFIFGAIIVGALYFILRPSEKLENEIAEANIKELKSVRILSGEKRKEVDFKKNVEIIRKINSEEMQPTLRYDYADLYLITKKPKKNSPSHNRIEAIFGEMAPFPEYEFNTKITIPEPNPYPRIPCEAL